MLHASELLDFRAAAQEFICLCLISTGGAQTFSGMTPEIYLITTRLTA